MVKAILVRIGGRDVIIDDVMLPIVSKFSWHIKEDKNTFYAYTNVRIGGKQTSISMHRLLAGLPSKQVDHRNRNGLDNRVENLRFATNSENSCNRVRKNKFGYRGVYQPAGSPFFSFQIQKSGNRLHGHGFNTPEEAARAYDIESMKLHGEFGIRNFPDGTLKELGEL